MNDPTYNPGGPSGQPMYQLPTGYSAAAGANQYPVQSYGMHQMQQQQPAAAGLQNAPSSAACAEQLKQFWEQQTQEVLAVGNDPAEFKNHQLPLARIKKIMKSDEDVRMISAEAPVLFAKACEMFILELTLRSWLHAEENKRRTLQRSDVAAAIARTEILDFLLDVVPKDERPEGALGDGPSSSGPSAAAAMGPGAGSSPGSMAAIGPGAGGYQAMYGYPGAIPVSAGPGGTLQMDPAAAAMLAQQQQQQQQHHQQQQMLAGGAWGALTMPAAQPVGVPAAAATMMDGGQASGAGMQGMAAPAAAAGPGATAVEASQAAAAGVGAEEDAAAPAAQ